MNASLELEDDRPFDVMQRLVEKHGRWSVLAAVFALMVQRKPNPIRLLSKDLNNHLLRDLGLPPVPDSSGYWDIR